MWWISSKVLFGLCLVFASLPRLALTALTLLQQMLGHDWRQPVVDHQNANFSHHTCEWRRQSVISVVSIQPPVWCDCINEPVFLSPPGKLLPLHLHNSDFATEDELPGHREKGVQSVLVSFQTKCHCLQQRPLLWDGSVSCLIRWRGANDCAVIMSEWVVIASAQPVCVMCGFKWEKEPSTQLLFFLVFPHTGDWPNPHCCWYLSLG